MVPPCSHRIPRVRWYSGYCCPLCLFVYRTLTFCGMTSHSFRLKLCDDVCSPNPTDISIVVWPLPLSLATTRGISFDFSSSPYLDVSVREVPHVKLCIHLTLRIAWVSPFGNPRIEAYLQLPEAYRSLSRPSSAPDAKAFALCSFSLELPIQFSSLELLEFLKQDHYFSH